MILNRIIKLVFLTICFVALNPIALMGKNFVVVIDAGHGGKDVGAVGVKSYEKTINLNVALKLGRMINKSMKDVDVIYTRESDKFLTLQERAKIANKANGDLFISIHTNSVDKKSKNRSTINGAATYTLGMHKNEANLDVAIRENSVIKLEKDYSATYEGFDPNSTESYIIFEISQNKHVDQSIDFASRVQQEMHSVAKRKNNGVRQAGFWVLAQTSMPAVLVELDFICNPTVEEYLASNDGQETLAKSIFNAFKSYKKSYFRSEDSEIGQSNHKSSFTKNEFKSEEDRKSGSLNKGGLVYKIQFLTSEKKLKDNDSRLKGLDSVNYYYEKGVYKYTVGELTDKKEALSLQNKMNKKYKGAFIVVFKDGKRLK